VGTHVPDRSIEKGVMQAWFQTKGVFKHTVSRKPSPAQTGFEVLVVCPATVFVLQKQLKSAVRHRIWKEKFFVLDNRQKCPYKEISLSRSLLLTLLLKIHHTSILKP
jgi:hypothetical protein